MLYSSYLANAKHIPSGIWKYLVVRKLPKGFDHSKNADLIHVPELSPSLSLLLNYKEDGDWGLYVSRFKREMIERYDLSEALDRLYEKLYRGENICLICYEKDYHYCHRFLLAQEMVNRGIEWKEIN